MGQLLQFPQDSDRDKQVRSERSAAPKKLNERSLAEWAWSWQLHLDGVVSPKTTKLYLGAVRELEHYMTRVGLDPVLSSVSKNVVLGCLKSIEERTTAITADTRRRALVQFFRWLVEEENEVTKDDNPMSGIKPRKVVEAVIDPLPDEIIHALLDDTSGKDFRSRRDRALIRLFLDSGGRLSEITNLCVDDVDINLLRIKVLGKGSKERFLPMGRKARIELDRYIRARASHPHAHGTSRLWLGSKGPLTTSGTYQMLVKRARKLGYKVRPHAFRHTFSHHFLANGGNEHALAHINGWTSTQMVARYAKSTQAQRAMQEHKKLSPGDRF